MHLLDWLVVLVYLVVTMGLGVWVTRRAAGSLEDFFVSGRSLTWWLAGTSMAATTFSIDTPLYVAGVVGNRGVAGNWEWWSFAFAHVAMVYLFARLWRRSEVVTDAELIELRYGGRGAALLRGFKAFLFAVPINCIGIGYAMLAAVKVVTGLGVYETMGLAPGDTVWGLDPKLLTVVGVALLVLIYTGFAGLWGVVVTDFFQYILSLVGALLVAWYAVSDPRVGGLGGLVTKVQAATDFDALALVPVMRGEGGVFGWVWSAAAGISFSTFFAYVGLQWWTFRRSDGGGEFIQRLVAAKDEAEAEKAAWLFNVLNYVVRTWPWVVVALAAVVLYPDLADRELGYPRLMLDFLPVGVLGLVVASLVAAFMSTISTSINWGASYLANDLYRRFLRPDASQAQLVRAGRIATVGITALGALAAFFATDVATVFRLVIAIGTGPGVVLILRWFWWRMNAWAEMAAMGAGFVLGLLTTVVPVLQIPDFGARLAVITLLTTLVWGLVLWATPPEAEATLVAFYRKVRPGGPGWRRQRAATGLAPVQPLGRSLARVVAASALLFGAMLGVGGLVLLQPGAALGWGIVGVVGGAALWRLRDPARS